VAPRYELGNAGGSAGKLEDGRIFGVDFYVPQFVRRAFARSLHELGQRQQIPSGITQDDSQTQALAGGADSSNQIPIIKLPGPIRRRASHGAGKLDELAHLAVAMRRQRHDRNAADLLQGKVEVDKLDHVGELHDDSIERLQPFV
jgi:hypothetical protein